MNLLLDLLDLFHHLIKNTPHQRSPRRCFNAGLFLVRFELTLNFMRNFISKIVLIDFNEVNEERW